MFGLSIKIYLFANLALSVAFLFISGGYPALIVLAASLGLLFSSPVILLLAWLFYGLKTARSPYWLSWFILLVLTGVFCMVPMLLLNRIIESDRSFFRNIAFLSGYTGVCCQL